MTIVRQAFGNHVDRVAEQTADNHAALLFTRLQSGLRFTSSSQSERSYPTPRFPSGLLRLSSPSI